MRKAFTLIELLIVVAIIAILAAIAVPNFLEAQTRAKVSRVQSDMRSLATALEAYYVDNNGYPPDRNFSGPRGIPPSGLYIGQVKHLTTPIAYMSSVDVNDPFLPPEVRAEPGIPADGFKYFNTGYGGVPNGNWGDRVADAFPDKMPRTGWVLLSYGPALQYSGGEWATVGLDTTAFGWVGVSRLYDPTNGTVSDGDIIRAGGQAVLHQ